MCNVNVVLVQMCRTLRLVSVSQLSEASPAGGCLEIVREHEVEEGPRRSVYRVRMPRTILQHFCGLPKNSRRNIPFASFIIQKPFLEVLEKLEEINRSHTPYVPVLIEEVHRLKRILQLCLLSILSVASFNEPVGLVHTLLGRVVYKQSICVQVHREQPQWILLTLHLHVVNCSELVQKLFTARTHQRLCHKHWNSIEPGHRL
mmetsp:Transcript_104258/g.189796  ORF Transcript_104258/g.189796 Transcript_104258/m.189796 type:complete len:203 (+) Transcript_104258:70-678(+)